MLTANYEELVSLKNHANPKGLGAKRRATSGVLGGHVSLYKGRGLDFSECREYAFGDDIRTIDWRVTARKGSPHTKVFVEERERSVFIIVDVNSYMEFGTRQTFKSIQAARAAALLAWSAHSLGDKTGAILFGRIPERIEFLPAKRSRKSIWKMLKTLSSENQTQYEVPIEEAIALAEHCTPTGSTVFIISDFFNITQEFERQLSLLSRHRDVTLIKVNDPADKDIPPADEITFSNNTENQVVINTNDKEGAESYRTLWKESETLLIEVANRFRSKIICLSTDRDASSDILAGLDFALRRRR